jgi:hypothetical protein
VQRVQNSAGFKMHAIHAQRLGKLGPMKYGWHATDANTIATIVQEGATGLMLGSKPPLAMLVAHALASARQAVVVCSRMRVAADDAPIVSRCPGFLRDYAASNKGSIHGQGPNFARDATYSTCADSQLALSHSRPRFRHRSCAPAGTRRTPNPMSTATAG